MLKEAKAFHSIVAKTKASAFSTKTPMIRFSTPTAPTIAVSRLSTAHSDISIYFPKAGPGDRRYVIRLELRNRAARSQTASSLSAP